MEFRTVIKTTENIGLIRHSSKLMLIGSCFSDHIGDRMKNALMNVLVNPTGTIFNPLSIATAIKRIVRNEREAGIDLFKANGVWNSYAFHSSFSFDDKDTTLNKMALAVEVANSHLKECDTLIVTLGTAVVYRLRATGAVVANCHKMPQHLFDRSLASVDEITDALKRMMTELIEFNPSLRVIFTVSPIRHIADGLATNSLSKATLHVAINEVMRDFPSCAFYFPSYEIMVDDLRDYRFYDTDMVHPTEVAIEYIWQAFQATYLDDRATQAISRCERVRKRFNHRPISPSSETIERFRKDTANVLGNLLREYPYLSELDAFKDMQLRVNRL